MQRIFLRPAYDEFLKVVVEVFLVKRRRIDRVKELFELLQLTSIVFSPVRVDREEGADSGMVMAR
jgi:hypothetical protein